MNPQPEKQVQKFEKYAATHPMGGPISDFEKEFYERYLKGFSGRLLDIGCGDGKYVSYFAGHYSGAAVTPCDISLKRIRRVAENGFLGVVASADYLPFESQSFDAVFLMQVIEHVPVPDLVIAECKRVLKPGKYCFVLTPNYPIKRVYDWMMMIRNQKWSKFFDDPTHCSKFSSRKLNQGLAKHFNLVDVFPTFLLGEGRSSVIKRWRDKRGLAMLFCHKLLAVCKN